jgi:hypothetical protein
MEPQWRVAKAFVRCPLNSGGFGWLFVGFETVRPDDTLTRVKGRVARREERKRLSEVRLEIIER